MKNYLILVTAALALVLTSCKSTNNNNAFTSYAPSSKEYKQALAKLLKTEKAEDLTFIFNQYLTVAGKDYLDISINGNGISAKGLILVDNWTNLENIKHTKGIGYSGAELKNLKIEVADTDTGPTFTYRGVDKVID